MNFNTLYRGSAGEVADMLDGGDRTPEASSRELQAALINALRRIEALEQTLYTAERSCDCGSPDPENVHTAACRSMQD